MAMNASQDATALCQLCNQRPTETKVYYEEVLSSQTKRTTISRRQTRYATRTLSSHGDMMTCSFCARQYENSVTLRKNGHRLLNWGLIVMIAGGIIFALALPSIMGSFLEWVAATPVLLGIILIGAGTVSIVAGRSFKQPMTRFLSAQLSK